MASQEQISQFSDVSSMIPPSQPDRSRTPRRNHQTWNPPLHHFRGPLHHAISTTRPTWPGTLSQPAQPTQPMFPHNAWTPPPPSQPMYPFPPAPPRIPMAPPLHGPITPQRCTTTTLKSPPTASPPTGTSPIRHGYTCRACEIPPVDSWKPDVDFHDTNKVNGFDFPASIRSGKFSGYKDIEGMDPLQVPLWKFLYQGLQNTWLRRIAYGRETFVLPFDNIGTTVFVAELISQPRSRNIDLDRLASFKARTAGQHIAQKEATQLMAKEVAQLMQPWLPTLPAADSSSQKRILELEAELAKMKSTPLDLTSSTPPETPGTLSSSPIARALQSQAAASTNFDPSCLLVSPGNIDAWLVANQPATLTDTQFKKWLTSLKLPQYKMETLEKHLEKVMKWWSTQPDESAKTIQRASVAMGLDPCKIKNASTDEIALKVMTVALTINS